jgi:hypothetical protein
VTGTMMFFGGLGPVLGFIGTLLYYLRPSNAIWQSGFFYNFFYLWEFFFPQLVLFSLIYPSEHKIIRRFPRIWILIFLPHLFHLLVVLVFSSPEKILSFLDPRRSADQLGPLVEALLVLLKTLSLLLVGIYHVHTKFYSTVNLLYIIAAIVLMSRGYRALQDPLQRRQAQTMLWGVRSSMGIYALGTLVPVITPLNIPPLLRSTFAIIALLVGAGSIAWSIVRHQFLGLRSIVRQSIVYSAASGLILAAYLIIIRQLDQLMARALGINVPYLDIAFVIIAVIFFQPLLSRLEELSERIFRRDRSDYRNVLRRLTQDIISIFETEQLYRRITSTLRAAGLTGQAALVLQESKSGQFLLVGSVDNPINRISFEENSRAVKLMANLRGPTPRKGGRGLPGRKREKKAGCFTGPPADTHLPRRQVAGGALPGPEDGRPSI